ncbi:hypothetical protein ACA910_005889 [Epithemia clementina (nom. ined.)]
MPPPVAPSRIEPLAFPVFAISWFSEPSEGGRSIFAYCGGGGSAKTGVKNSVVIFGEKNGPRQISTGDDAASSLRLYQNPISGKIWLMVGLGSQIRRYPVDVDDEGLEESFEELAIGEESCLALSANSMASQIAFGCESGKVLIFETSDDNFSRGKPLYILDGHTNAVCALDYAARTVGRVVSSAKDGTACIWADGQMVAGLRCSVAPEPKQKRPPQILVRGCAFGDVEGKTCYTVASARRGKAFLAKWEEVKGDDGRKKFVCVAKTECSACPISAMSLSMDLSLLTIGSVDGSIILWSVEAWKPIKIFPEVHHLPVTCIAARPFYSYHALLKGEEDDGVMIHARSASADSQLACLTTQRKAARKRKNKTENEAASCCSCSSLVLWTHRLLVMYILSLIFAPVFQEAQQKCSAVWNLDHLEQLGGCLLHDVLIAPSSRPGIAYPPY